MKSVILIAFLVASAAAIPLPRADYPAVKALVTELHELVSSELTKVKDLSAADNPTVGEAIATVADRAAAQALAILAEAEIKIDAGTLTVEEAKNALTKVEDILLNTQTELRPEIQKLSESVQVQILDIFEKAYASAKVIAEKIYAALAATRAADYPKIKAEVTKLHELVKSSLEEVEAVATGDDATIGQTISEQLDMAAAKALATLAEAEIKIDAETLTLEEAKAYLQSLETLLLQTQLEVKPNTDKLSAAAQAQIQGVFNTAYQKAQEIAQVIYTLFA